MKKLNSPQRSQRIFGFFLCVLCVLRGDLQVVGSFFQSPADDPDRLYAARADLRSAERAATIWEENLARNQNDFEAAWKLSRACYWLGGHVAAAEQRKQYERGIDAGQRATALNAQRPAGHFWTAANMGALAESFGVRQGLKYRGAIRKELETVLKIDPGFQLGSADRALGRWYFKVPGLFGGSKSKAVEHLQRSLQYDPDSIASHYFLAETFASMDRRQDASAELQKVIAARINPDWIPEDEEFKQKARAMLSTLK